MSKAVNLHLLDKYSKKNMIAFSRCEKQHNIISYVQKSNQTIFESPSSNNEVR